MANSMGRSLLRWIRTSRETRADQAAERALERRDDVPAENAANAGNATEVTAPVAARPRLSAQWQEHRARRAGALAPELETGQSNFSRAQVPWGFDLAAAWSWRLLVVGVAIFGSLWLLSYFAVVVLPLLVALFASALLLPVVHALVRLGLGRRIASLLVVVVGLALVVLLLTFVGNQVASGMDNLTKQVVDGVGQIGDWLRTGPLHLSDKDLQGALGDLQARMSKAASGNVLGRLSEVGTTLSHILAGFFIILFATYFFLADGPGIWTWMVRLFPRAARLRADSSGRVAYRSLTQFVRATVLVAGTDAIGVMIGAVVLKVPFVSAIGVLVFLGAFVPLVGATVSGIAAILVALVAQGPITAVFMLGVLVAVGQIEAHILQPFLMGRFVSVHPLGVIVALALGIIVAGIPGALIAVPFAAVLNAVGQHLAGQTEVGDSAEEAAGDDQAPPNDPPPEPEGEPAPNPA
ncbi:MAG: AI-2E family transporter [Marmoricola sp.]